MPSPTKGRARPPVFNNNIKASSFKSDDGTYDFIPEPDYSPPPSPTSPAPPSGNVGIQREKQSSGVYKKRISTDEDIASEQRGLYQRVMKEPNEPIKPEVQPLKTSGKYTKAPAPGAVNVMSDFTQIPKLKPVRSFDKSFDKSFDSDTKSPKSPSSPRGNVFDSFEDTKTSNVKQDQVYVNNVRDRSPEKNDRQLSPRSSNKTRQAPPVPNTSRTAPPPPVTAPVPPPPLATFEKASRGKLKQVHWTKTPRPMVSLMLLKADD